MRQLPVLRPVHGLVVAGLAAVGWGLVAGGWTPRGPVTVTEALASVGISLAVGFLAGWVSRSRWAMLLAPVAFAVAVELVRIDVQGPTVDRPHLSALGVLVLLLGRGVHGLLSLLPLLVGAAYGAGLARRANSVGSAAADAGGRIRRYVGRAGIALLAAVVLVVTVTVALPARTDPVRNADGTTATDGIAELTTVTSGDHELGLMIRGVHSAAPVLLYMPGPPGGSEIGGMRRHLAGLEQHFVVATWDRRGGAKSYRALDPTSTFTLDEEIRHALAVTSYLRERFRRDRIYLVGASGGSLVGVLAVQRRPELFHAYVGAGQAVNTRSADRIQYDDTLAWARRTGDTALERKLTDLGPPPYNDLYSYEPLMASEARAFGYDRIQNAEGAGGAAENIGVPEYTLLEKVRYLSGIMDSFDILYPRYQDVDLRAQVRQLPVPVYFVMGAHEVPARMTDLQEWYALLRAPDKEIVILDTSGHRPQFEQPAKIVQVMTRVLAETSPR